MGHERVSEASGKRSHIGAIPASSQVRAEMASLRKPGRREQVMRLAEKVAIISGGASGMGAATARRFGREGAKVVVADMLEEEGRAVADAVNAAGGTAVFVT